jgi:4-hydroxy-tetrahydrodipicolinate reductase
MRASRKKKRTVWIHGSSGRMGLELKAALKDFPEFQLAGGSALEFDSSSELAGRAVTRSELSQQLEGVDVIVDFSTPKANELLHEALKPLEGKSVVIGTTGLTDRQITAWKKVSKNHRILIAPNTSLGVLMTLLAATQVAAVLHPAGFDVEITETHHRMKKDAPSGTALFLANGIRDSLGGRVKVVTSRSSSRKHDELGVHSVRGGGVFGEHEVRFLGDYEELEISHRAWSRALFARGAWTLAGWILNQPKGLWGLTDVTPQKLQR